MSMRFYSELKKTPHTRTQAHTGTHTHTRTETHTHAGPSLSWSVLLTPPQCEAHSPGLGWAKCPLECGRQDLTLIPSSSANPVCASEH